MGRMTADQRQFMLESLGAWLREQITDERNEIEFELSNGVEATFGDSLMQPELARNGTATLTVRVNGGARHTQGFADQGS